MICEILLITGILLRGDDFRLAFAQIGDLRSIIPNNVHVLALTGTATPNVFDSAMKRLSLKDAAVIGLSPNRDNNRDNNRRRARGPQEKKRVWATRD